MNFFYEETTKVLLKFLDRKAKETEEEVATKGTLSEDKAILFILKIQFNYIVHLDSEISKVAALMDEGFENLDKRF
jgi:hypothetical protein